MVNLSITEFLVLAEAVNAMRHELREEARTRQQSAKVEASSIIM